MAYKKYVLGKTESSIIIITINVYKLMFYLAQYGLSLCIHVYTKVKFQPGLLLYPIKTHLFIIL